MMRASGDRERLATKVGASKARHKGSICDDRSKNGPLCKIRNLRRGSEGEIGGEGITVARTSELPEEPDKGVATGAVSLDDGGNESRADVAAERVIFG